MVIILAAMVSILLALGGIETYRRSKQIGLLLSSISSIAFAILALVLVHWWPLVAGFTLNWVLRLLGLDPAHRRVGA